MAEGDLIELTDAAGDIDTSDQLVAFDAFQKLCVVNGANLKIADFQNDLLDLGAGNEFTTPPLKGDLLTQATSGATMLVDFIDSTKRYIYGRRLEATAFTTTATISSDNAGGQTMDPATRTPAAVTNRTAGPLWYDWTKHPSKTTAMPDKAYIGCLYRGRAVLSGNPAYPWQWYMSRQADIFDWDYTSGDAQSAVAGQNSAAGKVGDEVKALIPFHDDYLIFAGASSFYYMRGDPANQGTISSLYEGGGIFGPRAYCFDRTGNLWVFSSAGLLKFPRTGDGVASPTSVSENTWPDFYDETGADPSTHRVVMGYDSRRNGVEIAVTLLATGLSTSYWYDLNTNGFFPESYPLACGALSMYRHDSNDNDYSDLLIGCKDGYIRHYVDTAKNDDVGSTDQLISSYVAMPVQQLGSDEDMKGKVNSLTFVLSGGATAGSFSDSDGVDYELHVGKDPETVSEDIRDGATALFSGTLTGPGRRQRVRDKVAGGYLGVKLSNSTVDETWSIEFIGFNVKPAGRIK